MLIRSSNAWRASPSPSIIITCIVVFIRHVLSQDTPPAFNNNQSCLIGCQTTNGNTGPIITFCGSDGQTYTVNSDAVTLKRCYLLTWYATPRSPLLRSNR